MEEGRRTGDGVSGAAAEEDVDREAEEDDAEGVADESAEDWKSSGTVCMKRGWRSIAVVVDK
jgi:hypothetical protein